MAENRKRVTIEDRRPEGEEAIAKTGRVYAARLVEQGLTIDDLGGETTPLRRQGDDRDKVAAAVRNVLRKTGKFALTEGPDEEVVEPLAPTRNESLERLSEAERACLDFMKEHVNQHGLVCIDKNTEKDEYQAALEADKMAGKDWERDIQPRLLANEAALLKKCVKLSKLTHYGDGKGTIIVGVYENGELAIRQRSQEIINARWTKRWKDGQSDKGELKLLFHPDATAQETGRWANNTEIIGAVKDSDYHLPADAPVYKKRGLVAAYEAVTKANYVASPDRGAFRYAVLEHPDDTSDSADLHRVGFSPDHKRTDIYRSDAVQRTHFLGAILWLRG